MKLPANMKRDVADALIKEAMNWDGGQGNWYAVDDDRDGTANSVQYTQRNALWEPWGDKPALPVQAFADQGYDYECPDDMDDDECIALSADTVADEANDDWNW